MRIRTKFLLIIAVVIFSFASLVQSLPETALGEPR